MTSPAVLGRFLHSLNKYCLEEFGSHFDISDYSEYNFAQVGECASAEEPLCLVPVLLIRVQACSLPAGVGMSARRGQQACARILRLAPLRGWHPADSRCALWWSPLRVEDCWQHSAIFHTGCVHRRSAAQPALLEGELRPRCCYFSAAYNPAANVALDTHALPERVFRSPLWEPLGPVGAEQEEVRHLPVRGLALIRVSLE